MMAIIACSPTTLVNIYHVSERPCIVRLRYLPIPRRFFAAFYGGEQQGRGCDRVEEGERNVEAMYVLCCALLVMMCTHT